MLRVSSRTRQVVAIDSLGDYRSAINDFKLDDLFQSCLSSGTSILGVLLACTILSTDGHVGVADSAALWGAWTPAVERLL